MTCDYEAELARHYRTQADADAFMAPLLRDYYARRVPSRAEWRQAEISRLERLVADGLGHLPACRFATSDGGVAPAGEIAWRHDAEDLWDGDACSDAGCGQPWSVRLVRVGDGRFAALCQRHGSLEAERLEAAGLLARVISATG